MGNKKRRCKIARAHKSIAEEDSRSKTERDNQIELALKAIVAGIDGTAENRTRAVEVIAGLCAERYRSVGKPASWEKRARLLALSDIKLFLEGLGISLDKVLGFLSGKQVLAESVVAEIKQAAGAWSALGRIGN